MFDVDAHRAEKYKTQFVTILKKHFPEVDAAVLADTLSLAAERGKISYDEIEIREDLKEDLLLQLEKERILIPYNTSKTIGWEDRVLVFKPGEIYEMPHVIRNLVKILRDYGEWDPEQAINVCLGEIGEPEPEKITGLFEKMMEDAESNYVTPDNLMRKAGELEQKSCLIIAELKGGGIISPCLRNPARLRYEVNPSLIKGSIFESVTAS